MASLKDSRLGEHSHRPLRNSASSEHLLYYHSISENPHKLPYYAALLLILSRDEHIPSPTPVQPGNSEAPAAIPTDTLRDGDVDMVAVDSLVEGLVKDENGGGEPQEQERIHLQVLKHLGKCLEQWLEEREWLKVRLMVGCC